MEEKVEEFSTRYKLNFTLAPICNEKIAKRFIQIDRAIFGKVKYITDKECYINNL